MNRRDLVAEMVVEAKKRLESDGWRDSRTVSVKIRVHKDLRLVAIAVFDPQHSSPCEL